MKIALPSSGILGTKTVEMRAPTFGDLREMNNSNQIEGLLKIDFVKRLIDPHVDFSKITKMDLDYLFLIAAFSIQFNVMNYKLTCPSCGKVNSRRFDLSAQDVVTLNSTSATYSRKINGIDLTFRVLSAQDEVCALDYALQKDDFESAYQDACACLTLGYPLSDIDTVLKMDASIYLATFLFQNCMFHGVRLEDTVICECKKKTKINLTGTSNMIKVDIPSLMRQFASVSDHISFEGFLSFTIPEFTSYIESLNAKVNG